VKLHFEHTRDE